MIVVTGAAGFIGSNVVAALNDRGRNDLLICDRLGSEGKWQNLGKRIFSAFVAPEELLSELDRRDDVEAVIHMGAISATTVIDGDAVVRDNLSFTLNLVDWCTRASVPIIYASSAATYGDGSRSFDDAGSLQALRELRPLNLYGWSKHQTDLAIAARVEAGKPMPPKCIGLKFFNVFGQNEYHKGDMQSVVTKIIPIVKAGERVSLFASDRPDIPDGGQMRDFVYVDDVVQVILWLLDHGVPYGLFNVGTGVARSFADLAKATFRALGQEPRIDYKPMPASLAGRYQYFTQASVDKLRESGCAINYLSLEDSVSHYVETYMLGEDPYR